LEPYYQCDCITIYHGDCLEVLPQLPDGSVDLVLTDPPYGINLPTDFASGGRGGHDYPPVVGDKEPFDPSHLLGWRCMLWGANYYTDKLSPSSGWLVWDKRMQNGFHNDQADAELAWTNCVKGVRVFRHMWSGFLRDSERKTAFHPTQKPVALMRWCLEWAKVSGRVLDPYMGAGPVGVACAIAGLEYVGIEIEDRYCEIAAKRIDAALKGVTVEEMRTGQIGLLEEVSK
jgi:DNA modification methylase